MKWEPLWWPSKIWVHVFDIIFKQCNGAFDPQFSFVTISITRTSHKASFYGGFGEAITGSQQCLYFVSYRVSSVFPSRIHLYNQAKACSPSCFSKQGVMKAMPVWNTAEKIAVIFQLSTDMRWEVGVCAHMYTVF